MRNIMIFAALMIGLGTMMAQMADKMTPAPAAATTTAARKAPSAETVAQAGVRSFSIPRDARGHFATEGRIDGQRIAFMVDIGGLVVRDVDAMVLPDEALSENLLGLSFLSKLKRFEYANGKMVLEQ